MNGSNGLACRYSWQRRLCIASGYVLRIRSTSSSPLFIFSSSSSPWADSCTTGFIRYDRNKIITILQTEINANNQSKLAINPAVSLIHSSPVCVESLS